MKKHLISRRIKIRGKKRCDGNNINSDIGKYNRKCRGNGDFSRQYKKHSDIFCRKRFCKIVTCHSQPATVVWGELPPEHKHAHTQMLQPQKRYPRPLKLRD